MITIRGPSGEPAELDVDIRAELEEFPWIRPTWSPTKLIAASPFRYDRNPSFAVIFEHGGWRDYGATDSDYETGGFVKLLAFLRDETRGETADYLFAKYGVSAENNVKVTLKLPQLSVAATRITCTDIGVLGAYNFRSPYLAGRGISESVQRLMNIGYDRKRRAVTFPWFNSDGTLGNVKFRRTDSKTFWYESGARPIREMLYGINIAYERRLQRAAIVEAEVDALTLMSAGVFAVATGGAAFTAAKRDLILRSPIEELTIFRDNDSAGKTWRNRIIAELGGRMELRIGVVPSRYKDVNEWGNADEIRRAYDRARSYRNIANFQLFT